MELPSLGFAEYQLVYNMFSLAIASMGASFVFFVLARQEVSAKYRPALVMSALVVGIAGYHYFRIFDSWEHAFTLVNGVYQPSGEPFNDAYRYVDWLLTVPLLVAELVAVLALDKSVRGPLMAKLVVATIAMIGLGYPGEVATDMNVRGFWGLASTVPFLYILYVLFVELGQAAEREAPEVKKHLRHTQQLLLLTWGFYPLAFLAPIWIEVGTMGVVALQVGYSIADITAKCGYGIMIYIIARAKMDAEGVTSVDAAALPLPAK